MKKLSNIHSFFNSIKYSVCIIGLVTLCSTASYAQTVYKVGASGSHTSIDAAYKSCTLAVNYIIEIQTDYNSAGELSKGTITLGANAAKSITIMLQTGNNAFTMTGAFVGPIFNFSAAQNVTIDGRPGGTGTPGLTIQNTNSTASATPVITFTNGASSNSIQYCTIKGSNPNTTSTTAGIIYIKAPNSNNNTIDNCTIQAAGTAKPAVAILSRLDDLGTGSNLNITISKCNLVDFTAKGIWVANPAN
ncbi:MAG: hypothetical protein ACTHJT_12365, partial [Cytophaga sp.]|uniref:hypothetical protein n=1 Tax=Cytophaga sp. TaxID=29535 RepID=UPI003F81AF1F